MNPRSIQENSADLADTLARRTLRASIASSRRLAILLIAVGLFGSWLIVYLAGGVNFMVPHWYYIPILFAAARFGSYAALLVALLAGLMAGPLTPDIVATGEAQEASRWLTRTGFFVGIGLLMAWLGGPSLRPFAQEVRDLKLEFDIRRGLARDEFFLRYQPIVDIKRQACIGFEALIRWQHPTRRELAPDSFLSVAESSNLIHEVSNFVIEQACSQISAWNTLADNHDKHHMHVAVNLSGRDLENPRLIKTVTRALARHNLDPSHLHIELTESIAASEGAEFQLRRLRKAGISLHIDDFGTGYSSLSYMNRFKVDFIKADRSLISGLDTDPHSRTLASCVVTLAKRFNLGTVAEGIESEQQMAAANELGFDLAQGYYLSRPLMAEAVPDLIRNFVPEGRARSETEPA